MAGAPTAKPAPFIRPLDALDRGLLLAESAMSLVIVMVMILVAVADSLSHFLAMSHAAFLSHIGMGLQAHLRSAADILLNGTIWAAFLGASFATRGRKHLAIDVLGRLLPERGRRIVVGVAATLGAIVAFSLARGIYQTLLHAAADAAEQAEALRRSGVTSGTVDRSYEFQFVIPGGFLLISVRLLLHAFHEFVAAVRGDPVVAPADKPASPTPYRETTEEAVANTNDMVEPKADAPVAHATFAEIVIALVFLAVLTFAAHGTTVMGQLATVCGLAAATLAIPLYNRWRKTGSLAPTAARESDPAVVFTVPQMAAGVAGIGAIVLVARTGMHSIEHIPTTWGIVFFGAMAILGAPLFTFLGGLALFLWLHGSPDVPVQSLANSVEDALGPHFARMSVLPTIPVFTLAGYLMSEAKTPQRLVRVARAWLGLAPGGLAIVVLLTSSVFTVFSGASGITIVAIGGLLYPSLIKDKYPEKFSLGLVTTGGALGITLPFCLPMIVYGIVAGLQEPVPGQERLELGKFMFAGIIPGALAVGLFIVYSIIVASIARVPRSSDFSLSEAFRALWETKWELLLIVFLPAGLLLFGPTIAAVLTAAYVLIVEVFVYKDLSLTKDVPRIVPESMILVGAIFVKLCAATILTAYFIQAQTADHLFEWLTCGPPAQHYLHDHPQAVSTCREAVDALARLGHTSGGVIDTKISFLIALNVFLLIVGMLMDIFSAIVVIVPLIAGIAQHFAINPYHLGVVFLFNLEIGYLMPPMGLNLFIAAFRFNRPVPDLYKVVGPFIAVFIVALMITTYVPRLTLVMVAGQHENTPAATTATTTGPEVAAVAAVDAGGGGAAGGDAHATPSGSDCEEQREGESFDDFDRRCNITGQHPQPAAPAAAPAASPDCDEPREGEGFPEFDRRCHITGAAGGGADAGVAGNAGPAAAPAGDQ